MSEFDKDLLHDKRMEERYFVLRTLSSPNLARKTAKILLFVGLIFMIFLFLPWQQNIPGTGTVTAFGPSDRPQTIETTIAGRISQWYVSEGQYVTAGDTILTLTEVKDEYFDPMMLERLAMQIDNKEQSIESKEGKVTALRNQITALYQVRDVKIVQAKNKLEQTKLKVESDSVDYVAEKVRLSNAQNQFERNKQLYEAGNIALTKFQEIESKYQEGKMKQISAQNKFLQSKTDLINAEIYISELEADYADKISKSRSDLSATLSELFDARGDLVATENKYASLEIRNEQYQVIAPQSGFMVKARKSGLGETVKEGEAVATIMPANPEIAVELSIEAMDVPLITLGRTARIQFDGWPAIQFSGWPNAAVGTFGGTVRVIDRVPEKGGKFRLLITPDNTDEVWPEQLRLGSGVKGWVMLETVPVWYELWRQLNGFPPSLYEEPEEAEGVAEINRQEATK